MQALSLFVWPASAARSQRFHKRQFLNRSTLAGSTVSRFMNLLTAYFESGQLQEQGLPTVKYLADKLHTSPRYLTDLLKQETGKTALGHLQLFLLGEKPAYQHQQYHRPNRLPARLQQPALLHAALQKRR